MVFQDGDIVKRKDGGKFSSGKMTAVVDNKNKPAYIKGDWQVWLEGPKSWINVDKIELVEPRKSDPYDDLIEEETNKLIVLQKKVTAQQKIVDGLNTIKGLRGAIDND